MLTYKEVIGTRGSTSEAATNHLAFNYFGSKGLLAIPMTICDNNSQENGGSYGDLMTFSGLLVYDIDVETGFDYLGSVSHVAPESQDNYRAACFNGWWTDSNSYVKRSIFMDDYVFSISEDSIKVNQLSAIGTDIATIYFANEQAECDAFHVDLCVTEPDCLSTNGKWVAESCSLPLYSPVRSSSANLCTASYDLLTGAFDVPCVAVAGTQYNAAMSLTSSSPIQLALTSVESAPVRLAARGCEAGYDPSMGIVHVPCINILGALYWADFSVETGTLFTMELTNLGIID